MAGNWDKNLAIFDAAVEQCAFDRKGKSMPYTSANGHMFALLNKDGELGVRLSKEDGERFLKKFDSTRFRSHGAYMRGYVVVPKSIMEDQGALVSLLQDGHQFVLTLEPK